MDEQIEEMASELFEDSSSKEDTGPTKEEKEERKRSSILDENLRVLDIRDNDKFDDGLTLYMSAHDDDDLHIEMHTEFLKEHGPKMTLRGRDRLKSHIQKHQISKEEKLKYNITTKDYDYGY